MDYFTNVRIVVAYLRGDPAVSKAQFRVALVVLLKAGLDWWAVSGPDSPNGPALTAPFDCSDDPACADHLEAHCLAASAGSGESAPFPWRSALAVLLELARRWLDK